MYNTTIPSANQVFPVEKILNVTGSHEIIPKLIESGIDSEKIAIDELGSLLISIEYAPLVHALCPIPEYVVIEQDSPVGIEHLRIQWKLRQAVEEVDYLKKNFPEQIARYDAAVLRRDYYLDNISVVKSIKPKKLSQLRLEMNTRIDKSYDRGIIGLRVASIEEVNTEMYGLRGFVCLTAGPGCGKTALTVQWILEAMELDDDVCGLFVSLEIEPSVIYERMYKLVGDMSTRSLRFNSHNIDIEKQKEAARLIADQALEKFEHRLDILDLDDCKGIDIEDLIALGNNLKESSGCSKIMIVIDYLQLFPTPELDNKRVSDLDRDKIIMDKIKNLGKAFPDEPVLVISESRKPIKSGDAWAQSAADISGSGRFGYGFEGVMHINKASAKDILEFAGINDIRLESPAKEKEFLTAVYKELKYRGSVFCYVELTKMRGGELFRVLMEFCYRKDRFSRATCLQSGDILETARRKVFSS